MFVSTFRFQNSDKIISLTNSEKEGVDNLISFLVDNLYIMDWTLVDHDKSKKENYYVISSESTISDKRVLKYFLKMTCQSFKDLHSLCVKHTFDDYYGQTWSIQVELKH